MTRNDFNVSLKKELNGLPEEDIKRSIEFYNEIIDDLTEDGETEENAVAMQGEPKRIAEEILASFASGKQISLTPAKQAKSASKKFKSAINKVFNLYMGFVYINLCRSAIRLFDTPPVTNPDLYYKCVISMIAGAFILLAVLAWGVFNILRLTKAGKHFDFVSPVLFIIGMILYGLCHMAILIFQAWRYL